MLLPIPVLSNIVARHADDASFLWEQRKMALSSSKYDLNALCNLDNRLFANIEGLELSGEAAWNECGNRLENGSEGDNFVVAVCAFGSANEEWISLVLEKAKDNADLLNEIIFALGWMPYDRAKPHIKRLIAEQSPALCGIGIAASAIHGIDPGKYLTDALPNKDIALKTRALKAAGELGQTNRLPLVETSLAHEDEKCRFYAAWSSTLLGSDNGIPVLKNLAMTSKQYGEEAAKIALRKMSTKEALAWQSRLAQNAETLKLAIMGAGALGNPALMPWIIEQMNTPELARVAGEAFTMITGVDIALEDLEGEWPEGFEAGPNDDPEDENVEMDPDEDLPWPNQALISSWWENNKSGFGNATRYLVGLPITEANLNQILRTGNQRQRYVAALELILLKPGQPLFNVSAPGFRQIKLLAG